MENRGATSLDDLQLVLVASPALFVADETTQRVPSLVPVRVAPLCPSRHTPLTRLLVARSVSCVLLTLQSILSRAQMVALTVEVRLRCTDPMAESPSVSLLLQQRSSSRALASAVVRLPTSAPELL